MWLTVSSLSPHNISLPTHEYDRGRQEKIERQTNKQSLGLPRAEKRYCNTTYMCGLSLAWVTSENSTMLLESDILRLFFTGPYLSPRLSVLVSGVDCPSVVSSRNCLLLLSNYQLCLSGSRRQLSFASPYHFRVRRDFMSKNPLSGFAPKQTIESSALAAYPHSATHLPSFSVFALIQLKANFYSAVKRDSFSLLKFPFPSPIYVTSSAIPSVTWFFNSFRVFHTSCK